MPWVNLTFLRKGPSFFMHCSKGFLLLKFSSWLLKQNLLWCAVFFRALMAQTKEFLVEMNEMAWWLSLDLVDYDTKVLSLVGYKKPANFKSV